MDRQSQLNLLLRSIKCSERSYVRFLNKSSRVVDLYWLNYQGKLVLYKTLRPAEHFDIDTFVTHPWIFRDHLTRQLLVAKHRPIFYPRPAHPEEPSRSTVEITIPVYSLKDMCLHCVSGSVKRENIRSLSIPIQLIEDLEKISKK